MSHVLLWLLLLVSFSLQTRGVSFQGYDKDKGQEKFKSNEGTLLSDLMNRSACRARETLISVYDEFPEEMQYNIMPRCMPVQRCLGCCRDEARKCVPLTTEIVKLQVYRILENKTIFLPFEKHTHCGCRRRRNKN